MSQIVRVPQLAWHGPGDLDLALPETWEVEVCLMAGHDRRPLADDEIGSAVRSPIGMPPLREYARGKREVVILFDDMTRPTRAAKIVPFLLEELARAGIPDGRIRFVAALGNHGPMDRFAFVKKLGEDVLARFRVYNHNPHGNCTYVGTTSRGTEVSINAEVMCCDLKIALGAVMPHDGMIFSGGAKIVLPGVASRESTIANHSLTRGPYETNQARLDLEEVGRMVGLDMVIDCLVNYWGETAAIFAGNPAEAHAAAVAEARSHYLCPKAEAKQIVIANAYAKVMESSISMKAAVSVSQEGGSLVIIASAPEGQVIHYLGSAWGRAGIESGPKVRGRVPPHRLPAHVDRLIKFTEYPDAAGLEFLGPDEKVVQVTRWDYVVAKLLEVHGEKARVAVYPNGDILYFG